MFIEELWSSHQSTTQDGELLAMPIKYKIFSHIIRNLSTKKSKDSFYSFIQLANVVFGDGEGTPDNAAQIGSMYSEYSDYFNITKQQIQEESVAKIQVRWELVRRDFPLLFGETLGRHTTDEIVKAIDDEIATEKRQSRSNERFVVDQVEQIKTALFDEKTHYIYQADIVELIDIQLDDWEGQRLEILCDDGLLTGLFLSHTDNIVIFSSTKQIPLFSETILLRLAKIQFFDFIRHMITNTEFHNDLFKKILLHTPSYEIDQEIEEHSLRGHLERARLDPFQKTAIENAIKREISFIFGPPGTGKTRTLGYLILIYHLLFPEQKILISAVANVAVDQIALAFVNALRDLHIQLQQGIVLRYGNAKDDRILQEELFFPLLKEIQEKRNELLTIRKQIAENQKNSIPLPELTLQRAITHQKLQELLAKRLADAKIIFTTSIRPCYDPHFIDQLSFDLVILDEVSMLPYPQALCLSLSATRKLVFSGDPKQLSPIALSNSDHAQKWLHRSILDIFELEQGKHQPLVTMLQTQRRMDPEICDLINEMFYENKLHTDVQPRPIEPYADKPVLFLHLEKGCVERKNSSRFNEHSATCSIGVARLCLEGNPETPSISIITPYREQAFLIREKLKNDGLDKFIRVGTIHSFQGSESDVIIFDMVDHLDFERTKENSDKNKHKTSIGLLYHGKSGERLLNVAFSRAKSKLIVIGQKKTLSYSKLSDLVTKKSKDLMEEIEKTTYLFNEYYAEKEKTDKQEEYTLMIDFFLKGFSQNLRKEYHLAKRQNLINIENDHRAVKEKKEKTQSFIEDKLLEAIYAQRNAVFEQIKKTLQVQYPIYHPKDPSRIITIPDFAFFVGEKKIAIFCDGEQYHSGEETTKKDKEKRGIIEKMGWEIIVFSGKQILFEIEDCLKQISSMYYKTLLQKAKRLMQ